MDGRDFALGASRVQRFGVMRDCFCDPLVGPFALLQSAEDILAEED
jgi:hypothetical protein